MEPFITQLLKKMQITRSTRFEELHCLRGIGKDRIYNTMILLTTLVAAQLQARACLLIISQFRHKENSPPLYCYMGNIPHRDEKF